MAFTQGQLITASELNSINSTASYAISFPGGADWIQDYFGNQGRFYSHRPAGSLLFQMAFNCGWFGGGKLMVERLDASFNVVETLYNTEHSWNTHLTIQIMSKGPSWYRVYSGTAFQIDATTLYYYCGQNDCTAGKLLTYYDDFRQSGNRLVGNPLTINVLNGGRVGTINI